MLTKVLKLFLRRSWIDEPVKTSRKMWVNGFFFQKSKCLNCSEKLSHYQEPLRSNGNRSRNTDVFAKRIMLARTGKTLAIRFEVDAMTVRTGTTDITWPYTHTVMDFVPRGRVQHVSDPPKTTSAARARSNYATIFSCFFFPYFSFFASLLPSHSPSFFSPTRFFFVSHFFRRYFHFHAFVVGRRQARSVRGHGVRVLR